MVLQLAFVIILIIIGVYFWYSNQHLVLEKGKYLFLNPEVFHDPLRISIKFRLDAEPEEAVLLSKCNGKIGWYLRIDKNKIIVYRGSHEVAFPYKFIKDGIYEIILNYDGKDLSADISGTTGSVRIKEPCTTALAPNAEVFKVGDGNFPLSVYSLSIKDSVTELSWSFPDRMPSNGDAGGFLEIYNGTL